MFTGGRRQNRKVRPDLEPSTALSFEGSRVRLLLAQRIPVSSHQDNCNTTRPGHVGWVSLVHGACVRTSDRCDNCTTAASASAATTTASTEMLLLLLALQLPALSPLGLGPAQTGRACPVLCPEGLPCLMASFSDANGEEMKESEL